MIVLSVLLTILKIIGIILLVLLGLILLILLTILFVPIRYRVQGEFEEQRGGEAGVSWLGPIIKVTAGYYMDRSLFYNLKIFGLLFYSNGDEKTVISRFLSWKEKRDKKKAEKEAKKAEKEAAKKAKEAAKADTKAAKADVDSKATTDSADQDDFAEFGRYDEFEKTDDAEPVTEEEVEILDSIEELPAVPEPKMSLKEKILDLRLRILALFTVVKGMITGVFHKVISVMKMIPGKVISILEAVQNKEEKLLEKIEDLVDKFEALEAFYYENQTQYAVQKMLRIVINLIKYILPTKKKGYVYYGLDDPSMTGKIFGACCALGIATSDDFKVYPNFEEQEIRAKIYLSGRIRVFYLVRVALKIVLDKKLRNVYKKGKEVIGHE